MRARSGACDRVLLVDDGSVATFAIEPLDEIVGACVKGIREAKKNRVDYAWRIRSFGAFFIVFFYMSLMLKYRNEQVRLYISHPPYHRTCSSSGGTAPDPGLHDLSLCA